MKNQFKFMPLHWSDYDVETIHLETAAEHGAYLLLLGHYWRRGQAIPDNDATLSRITRLSMDEWLKLKPTICSFFEYDDGVWRHSGVEQQFIECRKASQRGRDSANKRWHPEVVKLTPKKQ